MRYLGASAAVLAAATTFSLTPLDRTARASEAEPAVGSLIDSNTIVPLSGTLTFDIKRYKKPKLLQAWVEYFRPPRCEEISMGEWKPPAADINKMAQNCDKDTKNPTMKCGEVTFDTVTGKLANGDCPDKTFTFAGIFYKWTAHNNQSTAPAPADKVADTFKAKWNSPDQVFKEDFTFKINVPVVRPDDEATKFKAWPPAVPAIAQWKQKLHPPSSDPTFDFSGECVQESDAGGPATCTVRATCPDKCWFPTSAMAPFTMITGGSWIVGQIDNASRTACPAGFDDTKPSVQNIWGYDYVGAGSDYVNYYRLQSRADVPLPCGNTLPQRMKIHAPSDPAASFTAYGATNTGNINTLGASESLTKVKSKRSGKSMKETWP